MYQGTQFRVANPMPAYGVAGVGMRNHSHIRARGIGFTVILFEWTMAKIEQYVIDRILDAAKIEEVVGDFVDLKKKGPRYLGLCPFHEDRHVGSFVVYPAKNCYRCFSCDAKGGVIDFLMDNQKMSYPDAIRWLGKKYHIEVDDIPVDWTPANRPSPPPLKMLELPMGMVVKRFSSNNNLCLWMRSLDWDGAQRKRLDEVFANYYVGTSKHGHTIFWQIDEQERVRTGKMMKYYPPGHEKAGHRDKESKWSFDFIHATLARHYDEEKKEMSYDPPYPYPDIYNPDEQEMKQTLFGMHLLNRYPNAEVHIVESEKTALIMATAYGNHLHQVWMACGGVENLSAEKLKPIIEQHRRIILYPDRDGIDRWRAKQANLRYERMTINVQAVKEWWKPEDGEKADIADVVVRMIQAHTMPPKVTIGKLAKENPAIKLMVDKLKLEEKEQDE